jgi:hypothetical protein
VVYINTVECEQPHARTWLQEQEPKEPCGHTCHFQLDGSRRLADQCRNQDYNMIREQIVADNSTLKYIIN